MNCLHVKRMNILAESICSYVVDQTRIERNNKIVFIFQGRFSDNLLSLVHREDSNVSIGIQILDPALNLTNQTKPTGIKTKQKTYLFTPDK